MRRNRAIGFTRRLRTPRVPSFIPITFSAGSLSVHGRLSDTFEIVEGCALRLAPLILIVVIAVVLPGCAVVRTTAAVTGAVVSTTAVVAGAAVKGTARAVSSIGEDDEEEAPAPAPN